jgi:hypothetical protein
MVTGSQSRVWSGPYIDYPEISVCVVLIPITCDIFSSLKVSEGFNFYLMIPKARLHAHLQYISVCSKMLEEW